MRRTAIALALVFLAACGSGDDEPAAPATTVAPPTTTTTAAPATTAAPTTTAAPVRATTTAPGAIVPGPITLANMVGEDLQLAQDTMQAAGLYTLRSHDATGAGRQQVIDRSWKVCDQSPKAGTKVATSQVVDFGVVRDEESCP